MLGKTIKVDKTTNTTQRARYARVCIEMDLAQPLVLSVSVFENPQTVEFEGLHLICFNCGKYGHKTA